MRRIVVCFLTTLLLTGCAELREDSLVSLRVPEEAPVYASGVPVYGTAACSDTPADAMQNPELDPYLGVDITFLAVGDNLIHPNIYMDARKRGTAEKEYDFLPMYTDVSARIREADFAFINQETVMAGESYGYSGYPTFNSPRQLGLDLVSLEFDIIGLANNHMLDMGPSGLADTVQFWQTQPVVSLGASADLKPVVLEKDGV
ncbi:MAG: CapA family protein, partial [Clostridia bacterium]|nr:CapA family protein [Clostridia bacterium]